MNEKKVAPLTTTCPQLPDEKVGRDTSSPLPIVLRRFGPLCTFLEILWEHGLPQRVLRCACLFVTASALSPVRRSDVEQSFVHPLRWSH